MLAIFGVFEGIKFVGECFVYGFFKGQPPALGGL